MTPTQAQIEAAARKIDDEAFESCPDPSTPTERECWEHNSHTRRQLARERAIAALTAAAEVEEPLQDEPCPELAREMRQAHRRKVARTAAAEVGEQDELESGVLLTKVIDEVIAEDIEKERLQALISQGVQIERQLRKELLTIKAATIERCAQEIENYQGEGAWPMEIQRSTAAAAIRALKDNSIDPNLQYPGKDPDFVFPEE